MPSPQPTPIDVATERLIEEAFARQRSHPERRERLGNLGFAIGFVIAAVVLAVVAAPAGLGWTALAAGFVVAFALAARVEFSLGAGYGVPTQIIFVPMALLLPPGVVPGLVVLALLGSSAYEAARGRMPWTRVPLAIADASFSVAPALVLVLGGHGSPSWASSPLYATALVAQFTAEAVVCVARGRICAGLSAREVLRELRDVFSVDALLAPVGLLAAIAAAPAPATALLVLPVIALLSVLAREREARIAHSLELGRAYRGTAVLLRDLLEEDDAYTGHHTEDVVELSSRVAEQLGLDEQIRRETELGALLHDIGKIAVPDAIINKAGPLDEQEWAIMRTHTIEGQRMLDQVGGLLGNVGVIVRASHERWDGGGYPDGLAARAIPLPARIVSACDAFNAMTTDRSYRRALPLSVAVAELRANAGTQFDPDVVAALLEVVGDPGWEATLGGVPWVSGASGVAGSVAVVAPPSRGD